MPSLPWHAIDTVLLDMDGTLLDLHYDNHFWMEHLPQRYAELHGVSRAMAEMELQPLFERNAGQLQWYCLDFWSAELKIPVRELKQETAHLIALRADADTFLAAIRQAGKRVILITNAHRDSLSLKMERIELAPYFERMISSHDYGFAKENPQFWDALQADIDFDPARSLFIDDTLPILRSARDFGVGHLLAVKEPDSKKGPKDTGEFAAVEDYRGSHCRTLNPCGSKPPHEFTACTTRECAASAPGRSCPDATTSACWPQRSCCTDWRYRTPPGKSR